MEFDKGHFVDCDQAKAYQDLNEKPQQQAQKKKLCEKLWQRGRFNEL